MRFQVLFCISFIAQDSRDVRETCDEREEQEKQDERKLGPANSRLSRTSSLSRSQARAIGLGCYRREAL